MNHWLLKTEPTTFGIDHLARAARKTTRWDGVRNFQARNHLKAMHRADEAFLYHSSCDEPGVVGIVKVVREAYPDASAFDRKDSHYDVDSSVDKPRWYAVDVQLLRQLHRVITLVELRAHADKELRGLELLRKGSRLSITPVATPHWQFILSLE
jgi:predicted RNA-binding protein with PUA-like domain